MPPTIMYPLELALVPCNVEITIQCMYVQHGSSPVSVVTERHAIRFGIELGMGRIPMRRSKATREYCGVPRKNAADACRARNSGKDRGPGPSSRWFGPQRRELGVCHFGYWVL